MSTPDEFLCPITLTLMSDPVIGGDGHTYERAAITQWLRTNPHSPMTRQPLAVNSLKPNYALKSAIERFIASQKAQTQKKSNPASKAKKAPSRPSEPIPQLIPHLPQPSAPPADDLMIAIQLQQAELSQPLLPVVRTQAPVVQVDANRRHKILVMCLCFIIVLIFIVVISKVLE
jgi:hypothetical protein